MSLSSTHFLLSNFKLDNINLEDILTNFLNHFSITSSSSRLPSSLSPTTSFASTSFAITGSETDYMRVCCCDKNNPRVIWPLLWLSILRFSEASQFAEASEGFRLLFPCRKSGTFTVELWI